MNISKNPLILASLSCLILEGCTSRTTGYSSTLNTAVPYTSSYNKTSNDESSYKLDSKRLKAELAKQHLKQLEEENHLLEMRNQALRNAKIQNQREILERQYQNDLKRSRQEFEFKQNQDRNRELSLQQKQQTNSQRLWDLEQKNRREEDQALRLREERDLRRAMENSLVTKAEEDARRRRERDQALRLQEERDLQRAIENSLDTKEEEDERRNASRSLEDQEAMDIQEAIDNSLFTKRQEDQRRRR